MAKIELKNVSIDFPIYGANTRSLKRQVIRISTGGLIKQDENKIITVRALNNLNIDFKSGDTIGLIGHNGSGKSTLLKLLTGVYTPTSGELTTEGKISSLLDLSFGMDTESTGYENIIMSGILRGLTRKEIQHHLPAISEFTELGSYLDMPIRTYSSGMRLRLAFSLATHLPAEILLLDEVVGVGDSSFIDKARKRLDELVHNSEIVIMASHVEQMISRFCNKVLWLSEGKALFYGDVQEGLERYKQSQAQSAEPQLA